MKTIGKFIQETLVKKNTTHVQTDGSGVDLYTYLCWYVNGGSALYSDDLEDAYYALDPDKKIFGTLSEFKLWFMKHKNDEITKVQVIQTDYDNEITFEVDGKEFDVVSIDDPVHELQMNIE